MLLEISYATLNYKLAQIMNTRQARRFGADSVREYTPGSLDKNFIKQNKEIFEHKRGAGYWIWKPYIILDALDRVKEGDYVFYTDSGSAFVNKISYLTDALEVSKQEIMVFCIDQKEYCYSKRDAFVLMECDEPAIAYSNQICSGYILVKKSRDTVQLMEKYYQFCQDFRIVTDCDNVMGANNYDGFIENRHDQTVLSLLCKKNGIKPFRDPS